MRYQTIDIKAEFLPWHFRFLGALLILASLAVIVNIWSLSILLALVGLWLITVHSGTEFNPANKTFREYSSVLFVKRGAKEAWLGSELIFINRSRVKVKMQSAHNGLAADFDSTQYNAYLKFNSGKKVFLASSANKTKLANRMKPIGAMMGIELADNTNER